ncbi:hypothetical protein NQ318_004238 [Aromia moschata]|uniref:Uncharacterized protein n=1 Tax=Aromia moschata TaxID=1265417 RepID=A0AAV8Y617_9CUCU|nr:hypothetical protein NQ318_004238 [Aromia moschata]
MNSVDFLLTNKDFTYEIRTEIKRLGRPIRDLIISKQTVYDRFKLLCGCPKRNKLFCFILVMGGNQSAWTQEGAQKYTAVAIKEMSTISGLVYCGQRQSYCCCIVGPQLDIHLLLVRIHLHLQPHRQPEAARYHDVSLFPSQCLHNPVSHIVRLQRGEYPRVDVVEHARLLDKIGTDDRRLHAVDTLRFELNSSRPRRSRQQRTSTSSSPPACGRPRTRPSRLW